MVLCYDLRNGQHGNRRETSTEVAFNRVKIVGLQHIQSVSYDTSGTLER